ncbi:FAD-dependent oxidoreductase [Lentzea cavernae]|uniref:Thioredoxin reductase n=1 Tax=Lentzea cavernae TaxID=2020703 RepID=A0ABQ3M508_9PSEU|nr:FAD-dependent oxidoreductase [Lentzea cavernae]GHH32296.1 thioredoxin reductase [Lentzea cavernae]
MTTPQSDPAKPVLTEAQWARLKKYGTVQEVRAGTWLFRAGEESCDLIMVESGGVQVLRPGAANLDDAVVADYQAGQFTGELNLITEQATYLDARASLPGVIYRIGPAAFRAMMSEDTELSDLVLQTLLARRQNLRFGAASHSVEILGSSVSAAALALRTYAARQQLPHVWTDIDTPEGRTLAEAFHAATADLPIVVTSTAVLRRATPGELAQNLGLSYQPVPGAVHDVVVIGGGPAGLAAAVYGASEGLKTLLLDSVAAGGQAAASSRIENYLGFTSGISGAELTARASVQAQKFGARIASPCEVARLDPWSAGNIRIVLTGGVEIAARSVVIASGARYTSLPLDRWTDFEGAGIYYAATEIEARACGPNPVVVVGGANSAGQAALYLAGRGSEVTLAVRGEDLGARMSSYLADRILAHPNIVVRTGTQVTALHGGEALEAVTLKGKNETGEFEVQQPCTGLFCFIGASPATEWMSGIAVDDHGFILTDSRLDDATLTGPWEDLGRKPLPFETSQPRVFAAGDVRAGSMKRVAAAVGEGASAISSVHSALGVAAV